MLKHYVGLPIKTKKAEKPLADSLLSALNFFRKTVGVTGFEPATTRPPDVYSNRAELHPERDCKEKAFFLFCQKIPAKNLQKIQGG